MYRDIHRVADYATYATAVGSFKGGGTDTAAALINDVGNYDKVYLHVGYASSYPSYDSRGPTIEIQLTAPVDHPTSVYSGAPGAQVGRFTIDVAAIPTTPTNYIFDITDSALGRMGVNHWLTQSGAGTTARATYSVQVVGRGWA
jgi:hypothetical protein